MEELSQKKIIAYGVGLAVILIFFSWLIIVVYWQRSFISVFAHGWSLPIQLFLGLLLGVVAGYTSLVALNKLPFLTELRSLFQIIIKEGQLTAWSICLISFLAGVSEELLFRGAIQPFIGIWWTSFIFIGLHGYLNPWNWRTTFYGLLMFTISVGLGFLYEKAGLVSVITAHTFIDIVILWGLAVKK